MSGANRSGGDLSGVRPNQEASPLAPGWLPVPADVNALLDPIWPADAARDAGARGLAVEVRAPR